MEKLIENKVAKSGLITLELSDFVESGNRELFDLKPLLWQELVLKEKDFRQFVQENDWSTYKNKYVAIYCSAEAIIPNWAYMFIASALQPYAQLVTFGSLEDLERELYIRNIEQTDFSIYKDKRVLIKGCGEAPIPAVAFTLLTNKLLPVVKSLMFGEACSNVPIFKRR